MIEFSDFAALTDVEWRSRYELAHGLFIAEGTKTIERALLAGCILRSVITEPRWVPQLRALGIPDERISEHAQDAMEEITGYHVHRGALAAFARPPLLPVAEVMAQANRLLVIEDVVDHTNVGAIIRSAAAFAIDAVLLTPSCADPLYRRSIKVSMGAVFSLPWTRIEWPSGVGQLHEHGFTTLALTPDGAALNIREVADELVSHRFALVLGTEGDGLSASALETCSMRVRIPMHHGVDSLNVAAAAAVACFALTR